VARVTPLIRRSFHKTSSSVPFFCSDIHRRPMSDNREEVRCF
ncbi:unnamed protein product, partial [Amoebophrya sp. A25]